MLETEIRSKMNVLKMKLKSLYFELILKIMGSGLVLQNNYLDILVTSISDIINISMETTTFPQNFKEANVGPLLKKHIFLKAN